MSLVAQKKVRPKEKSYYKYVTDTKTIVSNQREYMKKYSNLYCTFNVTNEHYRRERVMIMKVYIVANGIVESITRIQNVIVKKECT